MSKQRLLIWLIIMARNRKEKQQLGGGGFALLFCPVPTPIPSLLVPQAELQPGPTTQRREICSPDHDSLCPVVGRDVAEHEAPYVVREPTDHEGNHHRTCKPWKKAHYFLWGVFPRGWKGTCITVNFALKAPLCSHLAAVEDINNPRGQTAWKYL